MGRKKHVDHLKEFKIELSHHITVQKMILFGSRAWGRPHKDSDFDILIVSSSFRNIKSMKRGLGFYKYWHLDYAVDFLLYTPEEFKKLSKQITIVREAARKGIRI